LPVRKHIFAWGVIIDKFPYNEIEKQSGKGGVSMITGVGTVTGKGQVQVPKEIREAIGIVPGDELVFEVSGKRRITVTVRKRRPLSTLGGALAGAVSAFAGTEREEEETRKAVAKRIAQEGFDHD